MRTLDRLNLKDPSVHGLLQRWYGYRGADPWSVVWTPIPEPRRGADFACVVETFAPDELLVRAMLAVERTPVEVEA